MMEVREEIFKLIILECVQGINFFENNLFMTGNFGEIVRIQLNRYMLESDEDFEERQIASGNLWIEDFYKLT